MTGNHYRKAGNKGSVVQCQCFVKSVKDNRGHHESMGNKPPQPLTGTQSSRSHVV